MEKGAHSLALTVSFNKHETKKRVREEKFKMEY